MPIITAVRYLLLVSPLVSEAMLTVLQGWDVPRVQPSKNVPAEGGDDAGDVWGLWFSLGHAEGRKREENLVLVTASCLDSAPGACRGDQKGSLHFSCEEGA